MSLDLAEVREYLANVDTTAICDADKGARVVSPAIRCRSRQPRVCGPAFTVRCRDDFFAVLRAVELASPGDVIVVDGGDGTAALGGELFARAAMVRGLAGIVVDGGYRDIGYVASCMLPVYSRHVTPMAGTTNELGELQVPITCGGVPVLPGDLVIADIEGVVVLDPATAADVLAAAAQVKATESRAIARLEQGGSLVGCLNVIEHSERLEQGEPTSLRFTV